MRTSITRPREEMDSRFAELAQRIEAGLREGEQHSDFAVIVTEVLGGAGELLSIDPRECISWFVGAPSIPAQSWIHNIGQPSVTVVHRERFRLDLQFWRQKASAIHGHISCGSFAAVLGDRLHVTYEVGTSQASLGEHAWTKEISRSGVEVMQVGEAREVRPELVHALYWPHSPTMTISVRCTHHPGQDALLPLEYAEPSFAYVDRIHHPDALISKRCEALRLVAAVSERFYMDELRTVCRSSNPCLVLHALRDAAALIGGRPSFADLRGALANEDRIPGIGGYAARVEERTLLESVYCGHDTASQWLVGLLWAGLAGEQLAEYWPREYGIPIEEAKTRLTEVEDRAGMIAGRALAARGVPTAPIETQ
ncbi:MAG: hypothetical protein ACYDH5_07740 [Acidimicrobiales bacterium]